jgi:hypothetical protein
MHRSTTILFLQDLRKSYPDRWVSQLLDHVLREHAVLDLIDGVAGLVGQSLEAHPDQDGATDVVSPDARPAALAGLDSGELLFFAVKLLDSSSGGRTLLAPDLSGSELSNES